MMMMMMMVMMVVVVFAAVRPMHLMLHVLGSTIMVMYCC